MKSKEQPSFDPYELARQYAEHSDLKQNGGESDEDFKYRVAGTLRARGHIVEAHEAFSGRRYDDPDQPLEGPMAGILGALAQALRGTKHPMISPEKQIGDDIAAGVVVYKDEDPTKSAIATTFSALGVEAGMDFLNATRDKGMGK